MGEWSECGATYAHQACSQCGTGGYAVCNQYGELGPCRPVTPLGGEVCGNLCDDNNSGVADETCAGSETFDYCEPKSGGGYTRWTCACGDNLDVGYCLGSADSQYACSSPEGCMKAPAFGTSGASQGGGNFRCCVSSLPCTSGGYVSGEFHCAYGGNQQLQYECAPGASCADANQCGNICEALAPSINATTGQASGHGTVCRPGSYSDACTAAQGGLGSASSTGGVRAMEDREACAEVVHPDGFVESEVCTAMPSVTLPVPGHTLNTRRPGGVSAPRSGGGGGGGGGPGRKNIPSPEQCGPAAGGASTSALAQSQAPGIALSDLTTRYAQVDVSLQGSVGELSFVRKYVSSDWTWKYMSMLNAGAAPFLASPFGASPTSRGSLRWWHGFYSFVRPKSFIPGVSTWAVRDTDGAALEYTACDPGTTGCFATPRPTTQWSSSQLFWTGGAPGSFILIQPGVGRFVYSSVWQASQPFFPNKYFLTRVEDEVLSGTGSPRVRLTLQYAAPSLPDCPGLSATGNGVPFLDTVTSADGARLKLYYKQVKSHHDAVDPAGSPQGNECVIDRLALRDNPNSGSTAETVVARFNYVKVGTLEYAGALQSVVYPETGDVLTYADNGGTSWSVSENEEEVGAHTYLDGKVSAATTASGGAMSMGTSTGGCPLSQSTGSMDCTPTATQSMLAGDSAGTQVEVKRTYNTRWLTQLPYLDVNGATETCVSGNCASFASGTYVSLREDLQGSFLYHWYDQSKSGRSHIFSPVVATNSTASSVIPQPLALESRSFGASAPGNPSSAVYSERTEYAYGAFASGAPVEPFKPLVTERDVRASVLVPGQETVVTSSYDTLTHRLKSTIHEGYTERFDVGTQTWSGPVKRYVGTFYFNHHKCSGQTDTGDARVLEVHGPCEVAGLGATDCAGNDFPITQYHFYGGPAVELSNRANRLWKIKNFVNHGGPTLCSNQAALETVFNDYDARGNATQITDPSGVVTSYLYTGGRLDRTTVNGLATNYLYDGADVTAVQLPTGGYSVRCYRKWTAPGTACNTGFKTSHVQWEAIAADAQGVDWSEAVVFTRWTTAGEPLKTAEYRSRGASGVVETRRVVEYHPDPHGRPTYSRFGTGSGAFTSVAAFNKDDEVTGLGLPFNGAPDFCLNTQTQALSELCARFGRDGGGRLTSFTEAPSTGVTQASTFAYDVHGQVRSVRTGCSDAATCQTPESTYQYDDFGNVVRVQLPGTLGPVRYAYNARGNLVLKQTETMRQAGEWQQYSHDLLSRPKVVTREAPSTPGHDSEDLYALGYDSEGGPLPASCNRYDGEVVNQNSLGRLRFREDSFGRTWYRYDASGRVLGEMRQRSGEAACDRTLETMYQYDAAGRMVGMTHPHGRAVRYVYGTGARAHRVSSIAVSFFTTGGAAERTVVSNIAWEPYGGLRGYQMDFSNGGAQSVEYALGDDGSVAPSGCAAAFPSAMASDKTGRLRSLRVSSGAFTPGAGSGGTYKRTYTWQADQVARIDTCLMGGTTPRTELYSHDRTLRLTSATRPGMNDDAAGGAFASQSFGYDRRGNRTVQSSNSVNLLMTYGTAPSAVDQLLSVTPQHDAHQRVSYAYDADGRVERKESGLYSSNLPAHVLDMDYGPAAATGKGSARETVFRTVSVNGLAYQYFYDAFGRRRAKSHPVNGVKDEFFHDVSNSLLVDQGWKDVLDPDYRTVDDYVWLAGRPLLVVRGRLDASANVRLPDTSMECGRDGEQVACGERFIVTDHTGKPVLMLDSVGRVAGAADYEPSGHVNRRAVHEATPHPYPDDDSESIAAFSQPLDTSLVKVRMRAIFQLVDMDDDVNGPDSVTLYDNGVGVPLSSYSGVELGRVVTDWVLPSTGSITVGYAASPAGPQPNVHTGVVVEAYEYQRYQNGAQPFWIPLRSPGQYHDAETDLFENWNRFYDPSIGRYLQPEPLLMDARFAATRAAAGLSTPTYAYVSNNPINRVDPTGLYDTGVGDILAYNEMTPEEQVQVDAAQQTVGVFYGTFFAAYSAPAVLASVSAVSAPVVNSATSRYVSACTTFRTYWFRYDAIGDWKNNGVKQSGPHFHMDPFPGSKELMRWHLPHQFNQWRHNFMSIWRRP
ncbi:hypothetical protein K8640_11960 [Myxococcus sp. XM-1-1-1]|uniref:RHS repeat-associated core domain-containing protein n=1 Tax=Myxococcus sp. XM-1-1-1 TaxID=2874602 RepID=UPI001CBA71F7|nr:RHS repeat-associated core domain-containing protein [Myxococcus sp. XM-1-1-1]MBZ4408933.1 hypothetical protein [Myxococcus sp. XM-1-1-1]